jgi:hypothetical protein
MGVHEAIGAAHGCGELRHRHDRAGSQGEVTGQ